MLNSPPKLRTCCSLQATFGPPEQRKTRRLNGLQLPLHPQQVAGWFVLVGLTSSTGFLVVPHLAPGLREPITCLLALTLTIHVLAHFTAVLLDPAHPKVRRQPTNLVVPEFDRTKHLHVIENGRCHLCNITTSCKRTKHCSVCNKCVRNFDHHCMWLNNCIGGRNYSAFIVCVISAILLALTVAGLTTLEVSATFYWEKNSTMDNITLPFLPIQGTSSLVVISVVGILSAIAAALLIHLCFFHGYIACLGVTTYEYVRNKREKKAAENAIQENQPGAASLLQVPNGFCTEINQYHFCKSVTAEGTQPDSNQVFICSTHTQSSNAAINKEKRNFHLYFSYETHNDATSIELSSRSEDQVRISPGSLSGVDRSIELKPSTPSPVSCCFSIMNHTWSDRRNKKKSRDADEKPMSRCTTVRRIQSFLRTRLRKNPRSRALENSRRKNRVTPVTSPDSDKELQVQTIAIPSPKEEVVQRPIKLPPLNLPSRRNGSIEGLDSLAASSEVIFALPVVKRSRVRRPSLHRRPRFKMSPHVTQSAQLSPIPESELSKPASPRSPQLKHFSFPPSTTSTD